MALLNFRSETHGVAAPPTEAISVNIETTDILTSPEEEEVPVSTASEYKPEQQKLDPVEEKPEEAAPPPEPEQTVKSEQAEEDTDKKRIEEEERQRLAEEEALRAAEQAEKQRLAEEALRKAEEAERQRIAEEERRKADEEAERKRVEEAERRREEEYRLAEERRRIRREAEQRDEERRRREKAEKIAEDEARKRQERIRRQVDSKDSQGKRPSTGRVSASRGSILSYGTTVRAKIARNTPSHTGSGGKAALVAFAVSPSGALSSARIAQSSGNAAFDQSALATVRRSSPFPRPPEGASGAQLSFTIRFHFR